MEGAAANSCDEIEAEEDDDSSSNLVNYIYTIKVSFLYFLVKIKMIGPINENYIKIWLFFISF